jgi:hypothetical protein
MSSDDRRQEAIKQEIGLLLGEYAGLEREGAYVGEWTIAAHLQSVDLIAENRSEVWTVSPTGQAWPMTWGLLLAGFETEKGDTRPEVS